MASITALGTGSGIDLEGMVTQLMEVERQSLTRLETKKETLESEISGIGQLSSALSSIQTAVQELLPTDTSTSMADKYASYNIKVVNDEVASAEMTSGTTVKPASGGYSLEVSQLAESHRVVTKAGAISSSDQLGTGTLTIELGTLSESGGVQQFTADGSRTLSIDITSENNTLSGLRDAINAAGGSVSASIISGTNGAQLVVTSKDTGTSNVIRISATDSGTVVSGAKTLSEEFAFDPTDTVNSKMSQETADGGTAAKNAEFTINGIAASSSSNVVSDVLDGVTLTLYGTNVGDSTTISVTEDTVTKGMEALDSFVTTFNASAAILTELGKYDEESGEVGLLQGKSILRTSQNQLRSAVTNTYGISGSDYQSLTSIGVSFTKTGTLEIDTDALRTALTNDFNGVMGLLENFATNTDEAITNMVGTEGTVTNATTSVNNMLSRLETQETTLNTRLESIEARYRTQFTALDTLISQWNNTSDYLTSLIESMNANSSAK